MRGDAWSNCSTPRALVQEGPAHACGAELTPEQERDIYLHYDVQVTAYPSADAPR
jgi:hypothetical protein